jgi:drug/metabolite transporter (DMT)-like permease
MSLNASPAAGAKDRPLAGILHMVAAACAIAGIDVLSKLVVGAMPVAQMLALRAGVVVLMLLPFFRGAGGFALFRTRHVPIHLVRIACQFVAMLSFFAALQHLPIAMVVALGFSSPIFVTALSQPILGEKVGVARWLAVVAGFVGAVIVVDPWSARFDPLALLGLVAAMGWALAQILSRILTRTESDAAILLFVNSGLLVGLGTTAAFVWAPVSLDHAGVCFLLAVLLLASQWLLLRAVRLAPIAVVSPFQYLELPLAILGGWLLWREWAGSHVFAGAALIVGSGLFVVMLEHRRTARAGGGRRP